MVDKDQAEINAITQVFPSSRVLLCLFHVFLAWQKWIDQNIQAEYRADVYAQ